MEGTISIQRIYSLGNYENLTVKTELINVPATIIENEFLTTTLQLLLLVNSETAYRTYIDLLTKVPKTMDNDTALAELESIRKSVYEIIKGKQDESEYQYQSNQ